MKGSYDNCGRYSGIGIDARRETMWIWICMTGWLLVSSVMDIRTRRLPVWLLIVGSVLSAAAILYQKSGYLEMVWGVMPGLLLLAIAFTTRKAGYGDGIVLSCLGMMLGGEKSLLLFGLSSFLLALCSLVLLVFRKVGRNTGMPFLPFLTAAWIVVINL